MRSKFLTICFFLPALAVIGQVDCCDLPQCNQTAQHFVDEIIPLLHGSGEAPTTAEDTREKLALMQLQDRVATAKLMRLIKEYNQWVGQDGMKSLCFTSKVPPADQQSATWVLRLANLEREVEFSSTEFCRGISWHFELAIGPSDLGKASEGFSGVGRILISYTLAPADPAADTANLVAPTHCGGRLRLMGGLSQLYLSRRGLLAGTARLEYRLWDLKTAIATLGMVKLMGQYSLGLDREFHAAGVGVAVELGRFGLQLVPQWTSGVADHLWELGIFYKT